MRAKRINAEYRAYQAKHIIQTSLLAYGDYWMVATLCEVSVPTLQRITRGQSKPSEATYLKLRGLVDLLKLEGFGECFCPQCDKALRETQKGQECAACEYKNNFKERKK